MKANRFFKILSFCPPVHAVRLGQSCRLGQHLAQDDTKYYRHFFEFFDDETNNDCIICHTLLGDVERLERRGCVLCGNSGTCPECEFLIPTMPHGLQDLRGPPPIGLPQVGDSVCLQCGWHPIFSTQQLQNHFRFIAACTLNDERERGRG